MGSSLCNPATGTQEVGDDLLLYLPVSTLVHVGRRELIYGAERPCAHLFVVIGGTVQVCRIDARGRQVIIDIYQTDDFFGETALVGLAGREEQAVALEKTMLMRWPIEDIEQIAERRPGLGLAFLRVMAQREIQLAERLESLSNDSIGVRVAKSLIHFSERLGTPKPDGSVTMRAFTHEFLAQYIGTSRELVNVNMADFRRQDLVKYSRRETTIRRDSLRHWIRMNK